jgi:hypothetical protein
MLIAEGGAGKTTILCQLALAVATDTPFLGAFHVETPGRVLLILAEEECDDVQRQVYRAARARGLVLQPNMIVALPLHGVPCSMVARDRDGNVQDTDFASWLYAYLTGESFALVVLDPLSRFAGLEAEKDNAMATRYVQSTEKIGTLCGATVLNAHHTNQPSRGGAAVTTSSARGSTAFTDGHRWVAALSVADLGGDATEGAPLGEVVTFKVTKNNYGRRSEALVLRRTDHGAFEPMEAGDVERTVRVQSGRAGKEAKRAEREAERQARVDAQAERERVEAAAKKVARETEAEAKWHAREEACVRILRAHPDGIGKTSLRAALVASLGSLSNGLDDATLARLGEGVRVEAGACNAKTVFLVPDRVPVDVMRRLSRAGEAATT